MNVTVTMEIPVEKLPDLAKVLSGLEVKEEKKKAKPAKKEEPVPVPEVPAVVAEPSEPAETVPAIGPGTEQITKDPEPKTGSDSVKVTKAMLRARGIELTKADKTDAIEGIFKQFGAKRLGDIKEENYEEVYKLMGELL